MSEASHLLEALAACVELSGAGQRPGKPGAGIHPAPPAHDRWPAVVVKGLILSLDNLLQEQRIQC